MGGDGRWSGRTMAKRMGKIEKRVRAVVADLAKKVTEAGCWQNTLFGFDDETKMYVMNASGDVSIIKVLPSGNVREYVWEGKTGVLA